jgi:hypothetical protein
VLLQRVWIVAWLDAYIAGERDMIIKANLQGEAAGPEIIAAHLASRGV